MSATALAPSRSHWASLADVPADWPGAAVTAGVFDGFHRGHRALVNRCRDHAARLGLPSVLVTFDPHPLTLTCPERAPKMLLTMAERVDIAHSLGIDAVLVLPFTRALAATPADDFIDQVLLDGLGARAVVVGENFRYGARGAGDPDHLRRSGRRHGFAADIVPLVTYDGVVCSSTEIRGRLAAGDHSSAQALLGSL